METIISDASPSEYSSPFYQENKQICEDWANFINGKNGKIRGKFTSWSLLLKAKINIERDWEIEVSKSTISNPSLFFSSKKSKFTSTLIETKNINLFESSFLVRPYSVTDSILMELDSRIRKLDSNYILRTNGSDSIMRNPYVKLIKEMAPNLKLKRIAYSHKERNLKIKFNCIIRDFDLLEKLIKL